MASILARAGSLVETGESRSISALRLHLLAHAVLEALRVLGFFPRRPDDRNELSNQVSLS
jgi:hypothetical protein